MFDATRNITLQTPADSGDGKGPVMTATFKTVGVVNPDGTFTIVKEGDDGRLQGWLVNPNTIEAAYTESGPEPYVVRETLVRKPSP
ncbi:MAG: hypothetical protein WCP28_16675 [Actinomycetes bacterium]